MFLIKSYKCPINKINPIQRTKNQTHVCEVKCCLYCCAANNWR